MNHLSPRKGSGQSQAANAKRPLQPVPRNSQAGSDKRPRLEGNDEENNTEDGLISPVQISSGQSEDDSSRSSDEPRDTEDSVPPRQSSLTTPSQQGVAHPIPDQPPAPISETAQTSQPAPVPHISPPPQPGAVADSTEEPSRNLTLWRRQFSESRKRNLAACYSNSSPGNTPTAPAQGSSGNPPSLEGVNSPESVQQPHTVPSTTALGTPSASAAPAATVHSNESPQSLGLSIPNMKNSYASAKGLTPAECFINAALYFHHGAHDFGKEKKAQEEKEARQEAENAALKVRLEKSEARLDETKTELEELKDTVKKLVEDNKALEQVKSSGSDRIGDLTKQIDEMKQNLDKIQESFHGFQDMRVSDMFRMMAMGRTSTT
ncbi:hypothetical protein BDV18DRAFT_155911 [Aspergillus unguis]